jgi:hypothetical protein
MKRHSFVFHIGKPQHGLSAVRFKPDSPVYRINKFRAHNHNGFVDITNRVIVTCRGDFVSPIRRPSGRPPEKNHGDPTFNSDGTWSGFRFGAFGLLATGFG